MMMIGTLRRVLCTISSRHHGRVKTLFVARTRVKEDGVAQHFGEHVVEQPCVGRRLHLVVAQEARIALLMWPLDGWRLDRAARPLLALPLLRSLLGRLRGNFEEQQKEGNGQNTDD